MHDATIETMYGALDVTVKGLIALFGDNMEMLQRLDHTLHSIRVNFANEYTIEDYEALDLFKD